MSKDLEGLLVCKINVLLVKFDEVLALKTQSAIILRPISIAYS